MLRQPQLTQSLLLRLLIIGDSILGHQTGGGAGNAGAKAGAGTVGAMHDGRLGLKSPPILRESARTPDDRPTPAPYCEFLWSTTNRAWKPPAPGTSASPEQVA